jgi:hypothetical protein
MVSVMLSVINRLCVHIMSGIVLSVMLNCIILSVVMFSVIIFIVVMVNVVVLIVAGAVFLFTVAMEL